MDGNLEVSSEAHAALGTLVDLGIVTEDVMIKVCNRPVALDQVSLLSQWSLAGHDISWTYHKCNLNKISLHGCSFATATLEGRPTT